MVAVSNSKGVLLEINRFFSGAPFYTRAGSTNTSFVQNSNCKLIAWGRLDRLAFPSLPESKYKTQSLSDNRKIDRNDGLALPNVYRTGVTCTQPFLFFLYYTKFNTAKSRKFLVEPKSIVEAVNGPYAAQWRIATRSIRWRYPILGNAIWPTATWPYNTLSRKSSRRILFGQNGLAEKDI